MPQGKSAKISAFLNHRMRVLNSDTRIIIGEGSLRVLWRSRYAIGLVVDGMTTYGKTRSGLSTFAAEANQAG